MIISDCNSEKNLKLVNRKRRYCNNESGTVFLVHGVSKLWNTTPSSTLHLPIFVGVSMNTENALVLGLGILCPDISYSLFTSLLCGDLEVC